MVMYHFAARGTVRRLEEGGSVTDEWGMLEVASQKFTERLGVRFSGSQSKDIMPRKDVVRELEDRMSASWIIEYSLTIARSFIEIRDWLEDV